MWAVAMVTSPEQKPAAAAGAVAVSIIILLVQFSALALCIFESGNPRCASHGQCRAGEYCAFWINTKGRCVDCAAYVMSSFPVGSGYEGPGTRIPATVLNTSVCTAAHNQQWSWFPSSPFPITADLRSRWYNWDLDPNAADEWSLECSIWAHCKATDALPRSCDFLAMNLERLSGGTVWLICFVSVLLVPPILNEFRQAATEELLLIHRQGVAPGRFRAFLSWTLLLCIRARIYLLPWMTAGAATTVLVTNDLTALNILLNLLAVIFLFDVDDLLAAALLPKVGQELASPLVKEMNDTSPPNISWAYQRLLAVCVAVTIPLFVVWFEPLLRSTPRGALKPRTVTRTYDLDTHCRDIYDVIMVNLPYCAFSFVAVELITRLGAELARADAGMAAVPWRVAVHLFETAPLTLFAMKLFEAASLDFTNMLIGWAPGTGGESSTFLRTDVWGILLGSGLVILAKEARLLKRLQQRVQPSPPAQAHRYEAGGAPAAEDAVLPLAEPQGGADAEEKPAEAEAEVEALDGE